MKTFVVSMVVLICAAIIVSLCITAYSPPGCTLSRDHSTKAQFGLFKTALSKYKLDNGTYPEKLEYLWFCPPNAYTGDWQGPYMDGFEEMLDAWGRRFQYEVYDGGYKCKITSAGRDGKFGTADDLSEEYIN
jgi:general secretion pathway protein G